MKTLSTKTIFLQNCKYFELNVEIVCEIGKEQRPVENTVVSI